MVPVRAACYALVGSLLFVLQFEPPRLKIGAAPVSPRQTMAWGQVLLEAAVAGDGSVGDVRVLRSTPPFSELLRKAVLVWSFEPARDQGSAVGASVFVAGVFRAPTLPDAPGLGEPPRDLEPPSESIPFPTAMPSPPYPPQALGDGVVLLEVTVGAEGDVVAVAVRQSAPGFDQAAMDTAQKWKFRPARHEGVAVAAPVYVVFGFRQPVIASGLGRHARQRAGAAPSQGSFAAR